MPFSGFRPRLVSLTWGPTRSRPSQRAEKSRKVHGKVSIPEATRNARELTKGGSPPHSRLGQYDIDRLEKAGPR